jgi:hypothetical protein
MLGSDSEWDDDTAQARKRQLLLGSPGPDAGANGAATGQQQQQQAGTAGSGKQPKAQKPTPKKPKNR